MTYKNLQYMNEDETMICAVRHDDSMVIIEPDNAELWAVVSTMGVDAYVPPPEPTPDELLAADREGMRCSAAQMGLALLDAGVSDSIFDADPRAQVIWTKATHIYRRGPILDAMLSVMADRDVDDLFRAAMATRV